MKKIIFFALCVLFTGCGSADIDWKAYSYYVWVNGSSHQITLSLESWGKQPDFENVILNPGEKHEASDVGMGSLAPPGGGWKVTVLFDDGTYGAEYGYHVEKPVNYNADFDPTREENYDPEVVKRPNGCSQCPGARWTYTFTDDDYDAAVKYGPRTE